MTIRLLGTIALLILLVVNGIRCDDGPGTPNVTTFEATEVTSGSAQTGGNVKSEGDSPVIERGIVWDIKPEPTIEFGGKIEDATGGGGSFNIFLAPLVYATTYYVRAYATNNIGTSYGNEVEFTTSPTAPILETAPVGSITSTSAMVGGVVIDDGGAPPVTERGVLWNTTAEFNIGLPTKITVAGSGVGFFSGNITGLQPNTKYWVFAWAKNSVGYGLGTPVTFTTQP